MMSLYESIVQGLNEAIAYEQGTGKAKKVKVTVADVPVFTPAEIKSVRDSLCMTQKTFAGILGVSQKAVEAWETGTNSPAGSSCRLLDMLRRNPAFLEEYQIIAR